MNVSKELIIIANNKAFAYSIKGKNNQHLMSELLSVTSFLDDHYSNIILGQRGWHVRHNDYTLQLCPICNRPMIYKNGYYVVHPECKYKKIASTMKNRPQEVKDEQYEKIRQTTKERYGVSNAMKCEEIKERKYKTNLIRYGTKFPSSLPDIKEKINNTMTERYGGIGNSSKELLEKGLRTCNERYGGTGYGMKKHREQQLKESIFYNYIKNNPNYEYLKRGNGRDDHIILCKKCNKSFTYISDRRYRIKNNIELCPYCNPQKVSASFLEVELQHYIEEIYDGTIVNNCRSIIKKPESKFHLELDVYLPELKLAFEFNGDKFHCNPKFYSSVDISEITHEMALDIWKKDARKAELCKQKGITLFIVWEDDWVHHQQKVKSDIKSLINKLIC